MMVTHDFLALVILLEVTSPTMKQHFYCVAVSSHAYFFSVTHENAPQWLPTGQTFVESTITTLLTYPTTWCTVPPDARATPKPPFFFHPQNPTNIAAIDPILATLESLKLAESIDYTATARKYGVSRLTLSKRHRGITGSCAQQTENARNLNTT